MSAPDAAARAAAAATAPILTAGQLAELYNTNAAILGRQLDGLSHADSLLQPESRGNCLNWIVGHIAVHRDYVLEAMGQPKILGDEIVPRYDRGSDPITSADDEGVLPLETLVEAITRQQEQIAATLATITPEHLAQPAPKSEPATVQRMTTFLLWHEAFHVGQTEYLRQLAGKNDKVI